MRFHAVIVTAVAAIRAGCVEPVTVMTGSAPSSQTIAKPLQPSFLYGLIGPPTINTAATCAHGIASVTVDRTEPGSLVGLLTYGVYTPMDVTIRCAATPDVNVGSASGGVPTVVAEERPAQAGPAYGDEDDDVFFQYTKMSSALAATHGLAAGLDVGMYLSARWELHEELSLARVSPTLPRASHLFSYETNLWRIDDNVPVGTRDQLVLGVGSGFGAAGSSDGMLLSGQAGVRHTLVPLTSRPGATVVQLRLDGIVDYFPNPTGPLDALSAPNAPHKGFGYYANYGVRLGLVIR